MALTKEQLSKKISEIKALKQKPEFKEQALLHRIANSPGIQAILGAGDTFRNQMAAGVNLASLGKANIPMAKSGEGLAYEGGKLGFEIGELLIPTTIAGRLGASTLVGALGKPESPIQGAGEGLVFGVAGEAAGPALKGAGSLFRNKVIEPLSLDKMSTAISQQIKKGYETAKEKAWGTVSPIMSKFGQEKLLEPGPYGEISNPSYKSFENLFKEKNDLFTADFKKLKKEFDRSPTIENSQAMVKQLGSDERRMKRSMEEGKDLKATTFGQSKEFIRDVLRPRMETLSPGFTDLYDKANLGHAKNVIPHETGGAIESAAAGNVERVEDIYSDLMKESKLVTKGFPGIQKEHELMGMEAAMANALGTAQMVPQGASKLAPFLGTPLSREKVYKSSAAGMESIEPYLRALIQSQNAPGTTAVKEPLTIEIRKRVEQ